MLQRCCEEWAAKHDVNWGAASLVSCWFFLSWESVMMEVDEVGFVEEMCYLGIRVINIFIGIHSYEHFFALLSPLSDLADKIGKELFPRVGVGDALL